MVPHMPSASSETFKASSESGTAGSSSRMPCMEPASAITASSGTGLSPVEVCLVIADTCREKSAGEGIGAELEASEVLSLLLSGAEPREATEALRDGAGVALGDEGASRSGSGAVGPLPKGIFAGSRGTSAGTSGSAISGGCLLYTSPSPRDA